VLLAPQPLSPSYRRVQNAPIVVLNIVAVSCSGGIITIAITVTIAVVAVIVDFKGREGGGEEKQLYKRLVSKRKPTRNPNYGVCACD